MPKRKNAKLDLNDRLVIYSRIGVRGSMAASAQIDGEPIYGTKFDIAVLPGALDVYFAKGAAH